MSDKKDEVASNLVNKIEQETLTGTSDTHVKVFLSDVEDAFKQAHQAINDAEIKYQALRTKLGL